MDTAHAKPAIRRFNAAEWPAYRAIRLRALAESPSAFCSSLASEQALPDEHWAGRLARAQDSGLDCPLAAELDGVLAGLAWAKADGEDPSVVNLFQMWVAPEARGRGVAAALLDAAIAWARGYGARSLRLGVETGNRAAIALYAKAGFRETGARAPMQPGGALLEQTMVLDLAP